MSDDLSAILAELSAGLEGRIVATPASTSSAASESLDDIMAELRASLERTGRNLAAQEFPSNLDPGLAAEMSELRAALPHYQATARVAGSAQKRKWRAENPEKARKWREENAGKSSDYERKWRVKNPDRLRAQKKKERDANYFRPFVAIDSEGQNYPGDDVFCSEARGMVRYVRHDTYLWGAAADDGRPPEWLMAERTRGADKKPLSVFSILDWLISLPEIFGDAVFHSFAFGYDATQIFKSMPYKKVYEILKRETYPDENSMKKPIGSSPVLWDEFAFSYIKGKYLEIWKLRDRDAPRGNDGKFDTVAHIKIFDTFSFFQQGLSKVVDSMVATGRASPEEAEFLSEMKKNRQDTEGWAARDIEEIKRYTTLELRLLARMMADMRKSFDDMGMRLRGWYGPGAAASALLERCNAKSHYGEDIAAENISPQQDAAHHTYFGGRIEMPKQGYLENRALHVYDIASAYPAAMVEFPSMAKGKWTKRGRINFNSLAELRTIVESASQLSMFKIKYQFPEYEKYHPDISRAVIIPFYPLPYRQRSGGIIFPARGYGYYMRDDTLATISWLEHFVPDYPRLRKKENRNTGLIIEEAWIFEPGADFTHVRPFTVIRDLYEERKKIQAESDRTRKYNIREKTIKLPINSVYGQFARSVGTAGQVPTAANPYYAAATTANCRRRLMEAALLNPHAIVFFATDGIVSTEELRGLTRVRKNKSEVELGDWEYCEADSGLFVMSGVYTYGKIGCDKSGARTIKPVSKLRGADTEEIRSGNGCE